MDLTLVTQHFAPHFEGGTEFVVRAQARELAARGHRVRVIAGLDAPAPAAAARSRSNGLDEQHEVDGIPVTFLRRLPEESYDLALDRPRLRARVRELASGSDLVHVHHWSTLDGRLVRTLADVAPVVVTLHDLFTTCPRFFRVPVGEVERCPAPAVPGAPSPWDDLATCARCCSVDAPGLALDALEGGLRARMEGYAAELAAARCIVVPSDTHAAALRGYQELPPARTRTVPHGLSARLEASEAATPSRAWRGDGALRVLFLGHRSAVKGTLDLVRALAALDAPERVELVLLGAEVQRGFDDELRAAARGVRLVFGGEYRVEELPRRVEELGGAHLAAAPSRVSESYGLVVDEALALGLPVWVSDRGAPQERVGVAGRVLPAEDPDAWRNSFRSVLEEPDTLEAERRAVCEIRRTAADAARELEALYRELVRS